MSRVRAQVETMKKVAITKANTVEYAVVLDEETWHLADKLAEQKGIDIPSLFRVLVRGLPPIETMAPRSAAAPKSQYATASKLLGRRE